MKLHDWGAIASNYNEGNLLLGNGASIAISRDFMYKQLYETARSQLDSCDCLTISEARLFDRLNTTNFEAVLLALDHAIWVASSYIQDSSTYVRSRSHIQAALVASVHNVHTRRQDLADDFLAALANHYSTYQQIFTTNYDLISYWSINNMPNKFSDGFLRDQFDPHNDIHATRGSKFWFLHGALHLYHVASGTTYKKVRPLKYKNLLDDFGQFPEDLDDARPLMVTEGRCVDKLVAISQSNYLRYVFTRLRQIGGSLVIFGHSLGETDLHIVEAVNDASLNRIAISMHQCGSELESRVDHIRSLLPNHRKKLEFFRSETHPLGSTNLLIDQIERSN